MKAFKYILLASFLVGGIINAGCSGEYCPYHKKYHGRHSHQA